MTNELLARIDLFEKENKQLKEKLSKIETLIINHNCDTGDIYYKYNSRFLKSELKQRILEIVYEEESGSNKAKDENKELKKQLEVGEEQYNDLIEEKEILQEQLSIKTLQLEELKEQVNKGLYNICMPYTTGYNKATKDKETQQKEFINYLEDLIKQNETVVEVSKYGLPKNCSKLLIDFYKEILQKYKEIIGDDK